MLQVRHLLDNGSLYFPPFEADTFRQDLHWAVYKCLASNAVGTIISADLMIKAGNNSIVIHNYTDDSSIKTAQEPFPN